MSDVVWIEDEIEFDEIIEGNHTVVLDFTAPAWCNPCKQLAPHLDKAAEMEPETTFVAVDIDKHPWAVARFGVQGVPTLMLYRDGEYDKNLVGRTVLSIINEIK